MRIERELPHGAQVDSIDGDSPELVVSAVIERNRRAGEGFTRDQLGERLGIPGVESHQALELVGFGIAKVRRPAPAHNERADVQLLTWERALLRQENRTDLEEAYVAVHAGDVVFSAPRNRVENLPPKIGFVLGERIGDSDVAAVGTTNKGHRSRLEQSRADQRVADFARGEPLRVVGNVAGAKGANLDGKGVVATKSRDFLDEVDLADDVRAPSRRLDAQIVSRFDACVEADGSQKGRRLIGGNGFAEDGRHS